jgi:hypothetical protein
MKSFPCCVHCQYPGCPDWNQSHEIRCWRCLKDLCVTQREEFKVGDPRRIDVMKAIEELREYLEEIDARIVD